MHHDKFDTNLLRTLDTLLVERSVTRAADRLCVSQPAMSGALQRLRDYFDDPLLVRAGRDMALTPLGESLVNPVRATLLQIEATLATRPVFDPAVARRSFTFGVSDYAAFVLMAPLLRQLAAEAPAIDCHVVPVGPEAYGDLEKGDLDLLVNVEGCELLSRHSAAQDLKMRKMLSDDFVCVVDEDHASIGDTLSLADYRRLPHVAVRFGHNLDTLVQQAWRREQLEPVVAATMPSFSATLFLLPGTQMIATVQRRLAEAMAPALRLKILECPVPIAQLRQILMWHPRSDLDPGHRYVRTLFAEIAATIDRDNGAEWTPAPPPALRELQIGHASVQ